MKIYLLCVTLYLIALLSESTTPTWLRVMTAVSLVVLCVGAMLDQYRSEKRMKELEEKIDDLQKDRD